MVPSSRSSGRRTLALEIERTPTTRFSKVTGKMSAPCTPAARTRAKGAVRASWLTSAHHIGSAACQTWPMSPWPGASATPRDCSAKMASGPTPVLHTSSQRITFAASSTRK